MADGAEQQGNSKPLANGLGRGPSARDCLTCEPVSHISPLPPSARNFLPSCFFASLPPDFYSQHPRNRIPSNSLKTHHIIFSNRNIFACVRPALEGQSPEGSRGKPGLHKVRALRACPGQASSGTSMQKPCLCCSRSLIPGSLPFLPPDFPGRRGSRSSPPSNSHTDSDFWSLPPCLDASLFRANYFPPSHIESREAFQAREVYNRQEFLRRHL